MTLALTILAAAVLVLSCIVWYGGWALGGALAKVRLLERRVREERELRSGMTLPNGGIDASLVTLVPLDDEPEAAA